MEDLEDTNIPDNIVRVEALEHAMRTCIPGEDPSVIIARARIYFVYMTTGRVMTYSMAMEDAPGVPLN